MLGFIGAGSMGGAILRGVVAAELLPASDIVFTRKSDDSARTLTTELGVTRAQTNEELVEAVGPGVVIVGVKPYAISEVLTEIRGTAKEAGTVVVSVAAGTPIDKLEAALAKGQPIVRVMPNVNSQIGAGMSALCPNEHVTDEQLQAVKQVFESIGLTAIIEEKDFGAFSAIAGCSPAWTYTYIDALSRGALAAGLKKDDAVRMAAQAVMGSAQLVLDKLGTTNPATLVDQVTSPGGTTIAGLIAAEKAGFSNSVIAAVEAAIARDAEMSGN